MNTLKNKKFSRSLMGYRRDWYKPVLGLAQLSWVKNLENYVQNVFFTTQTQRRKEKNRFLDATLTGVVFGLSVLSVNYAIAPFETNTFAASPVGRLDDWRYYPDASQLEFTLSAGTKPKLFYLAEPARIVVDLPSTKLGNIPTQQNYSGAIQRVRVSQLKAGVTRIVMDLAPGIVVERNQFQLQSIDGQNSTRWVLRPSTGGYANYPQAPQLTNYPQGIYSTPQPRNYPPIDNQPQLSNYPPAIDNQPQLSNYPRGTYSTPQPRNYPPIDNQPPSINYPRGTYSTPQPRNYLPIDNPRQMPSVNVPPPSSILPPPFLNLQQQQRSTVNVPPPNQNSFSRPSNILPPSFPPMSGNSNNIAPFPAPTGLAVPTIPNSQPLNSQPFNSQPNVPGSGIIEFGQPIPNRR
jgi:hypothetical protein